MAYRCTRDCVNDLEQHGQLIRVSEPVSANLEVAEIQRRAYRAQAPAILFEQVADTPFPMLCNLYGTLDRCRFIFRHTIDAVRKIIECKADPQQILKQPWKNLGLPLAALRSLPRKAWNSPLKYSTSLDQLPALKSWPDDGGPFITLPQVLTENPAKPGVISTNVGMYRVQQAGNKYDSQQVGLHFQIHRGIGAHYATAQERGEKLRVSIAVGGPPAHALSAVMPLPEDLSELLFAGMLAGRAFRYRRHQGTLYSSDADFVLIGTVEPGATLPEGPFGDHLGYYSLTHEFPVLQVEKVLHRKDAIWPFTVVGRPPQEDSSFGHLIHELTGPMVPVSLPGLREMRAVDQAGVHPLLIAIGSERYVSFEPRKPRELLTIANSILGFGQASLAKFLLIVAGEDDRSLSCSDIAAFFIHLLERVDFSRDLHFQTATTIDTLDYSGEGLHQGSKLVIAVCGPRRRELARKIPPALPMPAMQKSAQMVLPGILVLQISAYESAEIAAQQLSQLTQELQPLQEAWRGIPLIVLVDDANFSAQNLDNWLWTTFTRANPSHDVSGVEASYENKHWQCKGSLIIDARHKPHHAPPLIEDPKITARVDKLCQRGGPLHGHF